MQPSESTAALETCIEKDTWETLPWDSVTRNASVSQKWPSLQWPMPTLFTFGCGPHGELGHATWPLRNETSQSSLCIATLRRSHPTPTSTRRTGAEKGSHSASSSRGFILHTARAAAGHACGLSHGGRSDRGGRPEQSAAAQLSLSE